MMQRMQSKAHHKLLDTVDYTQPDLCCLFYLAARSTCRRTKPAGAEVRFDHQSAELHVQLMRTISGSFQVRRSLEATAR